VTYYANSHGAQGVTLDTPAAAQPNVSIAAPASGTAGNAIAASTVTATLASGANPSGTMKFTVFGPPAADPPQP
jgi:hypothetical protein